MNGIELYSFLFAFSELEGEKRREEKQDPTWKKANRRMPLATSTPKKATPKKKPPPAATPKRPRRGVNIPDDVDASEFLEPEEPVPKRTRAEKAFGVPDATIAAAAKAAEKKAQKEQSQVNVNGI